MTKPKPATRCRLILGDQLNERHSWFKSVNQRTYYVMMEIRDETDSIRQHIQKLAAFFSAMRSFASRLRQKGHQVIYLTLDDPKNRQSFIDNLKQLTKQYHFTTLDYQEPDHHQLRQQFRQLSATLCIPCQACGSEHFLTDYETFTSLFKNNKTFLMEKFYRHYRKELAILMDHDQPLGGQWNYDQANRQAYDHRHPVPQPFRLQNQVDDVIAMINRLGIRTMGTAPKGGLDFPINRQQALKLLSHFIRKGLHYFGTYQDAMVSDDPYLFHSRLSFAVNSKIIHPQEVITKVLAAWQANRHTISLAQVEGFVRQVVGWREYMRHVYTALMPSLQESNFFNHQRALPGYYWTGQTNMYCMRQAIGQSLRLAYAHHIQRLMITGNFALLTGVAPAAIDEWYLGIYADALDWVEKPNTLGMSQYADGGRTASKPYVASANYIHKMSDYCSSCFYDHRTRQGQKACPFNVFYWDFYYRHQDQLRGHPRIGMVYRLWDKMSKANQQSILKQANHYFKMIEKL